VLHARPESGELDYLEGLLIGYRGYDRRGAEPHFAFGHGLSYTGWTYDSIAATRVRGGAARWCRPTSNCPTTTRRGRCACWPR